MFAKKKNDGAGHKIHTNVYTQGSDQQGIGMDLGSTFLPDAHIISWSSKNYVGNVRIGSSVSDAFVCALSTHVFKLFITLRFLARSGVLTKVLEPSSERLLIIHNVHRKIFMCTVFLCKNYGCLYPAASVQRKGTPTYPILLIEKKSLHIDKCDEVLKTLIFFFEDIVLHKLRTFQIYSLIRNFWYNNIR